MLRAKVDRIQRAFASLPFVSVQRNPAYTQSGGTPAPGGVDMDTVKQMMLEILNSDPGY